MRWENPMTSRSHFFCWQIVGECHPKMSTDIVCIWHSGFRMRGTMAQTFYDLKLMQTENLTLLEKKPAGHQASLLFYHTPRERAGLHSVSPQLNLMTTFHKYAKLPNSNQPSWLKAVILAKNLQHVKQTVHFKYRNVAIREIIHVISRHLMGTYGWLSCYRRLRAAALACSSPRRKWFWGDLTCSNLAAPWDLGIYSRFVEQV